jgi:hypothetical protein
MHVLEAVSTAPTVDGGQKRIESDPIATFRPYGSVGHDHSDVWFVRCLPLHSVKSFNVPKEAYGVTFLRKSLAIASTNGIAIAQAFLYASVRMRIIQGADGNLVLIAN